MKNLAAIYAADITNYGLKGVSEGNSAFDRVLRFAAGLPELDDVVVFCKPDLTEIPAHGTTRVEHEDWSVRLLTDSLAASAEGFDHVFFMHGDTPLLDPAKTRDMYDNHVKYYAQYSFADGYPIGLTPEIIQADALKLIAKLGNDMESPVARDSLFEVIKKDINAFDIETDIAALDQRLLRVTLAADTRRNSLLLDSVIDSGADTTDKVCEFLEDNPVALRTLPAYVLVQVEAGCPQACSYCPWPRVGGSILEERGEMSPDQFRRIAEKVSSFVEDATINISLWGEPSLHSEIDTLAKVVAEFDGLKLLIETSGIGWRQQAVDKILASVGDKTEWIVSLDAIEPDLYQTLRGEGLQEARQFALHLIETAGAKIHVQAVRMTENEGALQDFYRFWKLHTDNIIIQKYDHFSGVLPERKITDLSPLVRFPCWHLKRDLHVLIDGTVPVCREDLAGVEILGNIFTDDLAEIWERGEGWYLDHISVDYPDLCKGCDEYYTYNF